MLRLRLLIVSLGVVLALGLFISGCGGRREESKLEQDVALSIEVSSSAFTEGGDIPIQYTCDGEDKSPPLQWTEIPVNTQSIALISDDPDAPGRVWVHWVIYNIPPRVGGLGEGIVTTESLPGIGAKQGKNDFGTIGYGGPCPPKGSPHRYFFKLYALDIEIDLGPGATKRELLQTIDGHILDSGQLMGTYQRR